MGYPKNPNQIVVKNGFYPHGLTELDVWEYYEKNKAILLKNIIGRNIMLFISTDINETVVKRKIEGSPIRLNYSNYDEIITGRTISIHSEMMRDEKFGIIDIDSDNFVKAKDATLDVYHVFNTNKNFSDIKIRYTGKTSFHVIVHRKRSMDIRVIKNMMEQVIKESFLINKYTMTHKRNPNIPNLDLYRNVERAAFISEGSLSVDGLKCMEINPRYLRSFRKELAKIK